MENRQTFQCNDFFFRSDRQTEPGGLTRKKKWRNITFSKAIESEEIYGNMPAETTFARSRGKSNNVNWQFQQNQPKNIFSRIE